MNTRRKAGFAGLTVALVVLVIGCDLTSPAPETATPTPTNAAAESCVPTGFPPRELQIGEAPVRSSVGKGHILSGTVKSSRDCAPIPNASIIFWLTNPEGVYDDEHRATVLTDSSGAYRFESNFPGSYEGTQPHIHLYATADGFVGTTDEVFPQQGQPDLTHDIVLAPSD
jgi:protocatechuate 3,4-dioxygenase beta subunit